MWWNFIGRSQEEIEQARADWMTGLPVRRGEGVRRRPAARSGTAARAAEAAGKGALTWSCDAAAALSGRVGFCAVSGAPDGPSRPFCFLLLFSDCAFRPFSAGRRPAFAGGARVKVVDPSRRKWASLRPSRTPMPGLRVEETMNLRIQ